MALKYCVKLCVIKFIDGLFFNKFHWTVCYRNAPGVTAYISHKATARPLARIKKETNMIKVDPTLTVFLHFRNMCGNKA